MVIKDKEVSKKNFFPLVLIGIFAVLIILFVGVVSSTHIFNMPTTIYTQEDNTSAIFNISINNTATGVAGNISQVSITIPSTFSYIDQTNGTNNLTVFPAQFTNTSTVLTWVNTTYALINGSEADRYFWFNATPSIAGWFNISVAVTNGSLTNYSNLSILVNDTSVPEVQAANFTTSVRTGGNYSGTIVLNATIWDSGTLDVVLFNITNSSGAGANYVYNATRAGTAASGTSNYWANISVPTSSFSDGLYNISIIANDSFNHINNSALLYKVRFDNTNPVTPVIESSSATITSLTLTITVSDASSGIGSSCTVDRDDATVTGTGGTQTITESGLSCGSTYTYTATCIDRAGNSINSAATSFTTTSCGSPVSGGGSGGSTWTGTTYVVTDEQFAEGYTKQVAASSRMKVKVGNSYHHVGVKELTSTSATIEISSDPVDVKLDVGEDAKVDVDSDGFYDIYVILNSISNNKADITVQSIYEAVPEGEGAVSTTGEEVTGGDTTTGTEQGTQQETNLVWLWIIIGVLVLAAIVGIVAAKKKK